MKTGTDLRREALREVEGCVCKDRQNSYGDAEDNFAAIAEFWSTYLRTRGLIAPGAKVESFDVAEMSGLIKSARAAHNPRHRDNWIDRAGYAICGAGIIARDAENAVAAANAVIVDEERKPAPIATLADYSKLPPGMVAAACTPLPGLATSVAMGLLTHEGLAALPPIAPGHNPDRLTEAQVGVADGWRLLAPEELADRPTTEIQCWIQVRGVWDPGYSGCRGCWTYRTKQPPGYFLPKPTSYAEALNAAVTS